MSNSSRNFDPDTIASFGHEWSSHDQSGLSSEEHKRLFEDYFRIFPWGDIAENATGFDMGCGSGRWARLVAPRVGKLHCIDPAREALEVAKCNLADAKNVVFHQAMSDTAPLGKASQDFGYSLGVLHHIPDTESAMSDCTKLLKPGAPFLVYLYYRFDNRPAWYRLVWIISEILRSGINRMPPSLKNITSDFFAMTVYWPFARFSALLEKTGIRAKNVPLYSYRNMSFLTMRTDSRDRFGTPLEQRFTQSEIRAMMERCGLDDILFSDSAPFWVAVGRKT